MLGIRDITARDLFRALGSTLSLLFHGENRESDVAREPSRNRSNSEIRL